MSFNRHEVLQYRTASKSFKAHQGKITKTIIGRTYLFYWLSFGGVPSPSKESKRFRGELGFTRCIALIAWLCKLFDHFTVWGRQPDWSTPSWSSFSCSHTYYFSCFCVLKTLDILRIVRQAAMFAFYVCFLIIINYLKFLGCDTFLKLSCYTNVMS